PRGRLRATDRHRRRAAVMRAILSVFAKEFRENLRERRTLITALILGPLFGPALFAGALSITLQRGAAESDRSITLAVGHAERATNLLNYLRQYGASVDPVSYDDDDARRAVNEHRYPMVLSVAGDFGARLAAGEPAPLTLYSDASDASNGRSV